MDDISDTPPADQLAIEHGCGDDIGTQLVNIESVQQTIREQLSELERSGMETSALVLESLLPKLDSLQTSLRKTFEAHARPLIRDLHVVDLPDDLLRMIFQQVAGSFKNEYGIIPRSDCKSIMSCRLVCHRFHNTSSHLLLHTLDVSITNASLDHLDNVSRHPIISRGVRSLHICFSLFGSLGSHSFRDCTAECAIMMRKSLGEWKRMLGMSQRLQIQFFDPLLSDCVNDEEPWTGLNIPDRLEQGSKILDSWIGYIEAGSSEQNRDEHVAALHQVYERYKQLLNDQQALLQNNTFLRRIVTAVARMPTIVDLSFHDEAYRSRDYRLTGLSLIDEVVKRDLLMPSHWSLERFNQLGQPPVDFLYQLPIAVGRAGSSLTVLHFSFLPLVGRKLELGEKEAGDVVNATRHLRVLSIFDCPYTAINAADQHLREWTGLSRLLRLFMKAPNLQDVNLGFLDWPSDSQDQGPNSSSIGNTISLLPWTKLRKVSLGNLSIRFDEFTTCLEQLKPGAYIMLETVTLLTGTWADLLDLLRTKADCASDVEYPHGGELVQSSELKQYFSNFDRPKGPVAKYIRGVISQNPLRQSYGDSDTDEAEEPG